MVNANQIIAIAVAVIAIIVLFSVAPFIGTVIDDIDSVQDNSVGTGTITFGTGPGVANETINVSTETYKLVAAYSAPFDVEIGDGSAAAISANLTAEINANSTLISGVDGTGSVVITTLLKGSAMNAYGTTTNVTDASFGAATITGALDGDSWSPDTTTELDTAAETWATFQGLIILGILAVVIVLVITGFRMIGGRDN